MNATTKKPGGTPAVFAIESAVEETRRKIAGSAKDLQRAAHENLGPRLKTEKDGRMFAIATLERLMKASGDEAAAVPYGTPDAYMDEEITPYRTGPQWDGFHRDLSRLLDASEEARRGFATIFTDALKNDGIQYPGHYRALERAGKFRAWGTPGTAYPAPKARARSKRAKGE